MSTPHNFLGLFTVWSAVYLIYKIF